MTISPPCELLSFHLLSATDTSHDAGINTAADLRKSIGRTLGFLSTFSVKNRVSLLQGATVYCIEQLFNKIWVKMDISVAVSCVMGSDSRKHYNIGRMARNALIVHGGIVCCLDCFSVGECAVCWLVRHHVCTATIFLKRPQRSDVSMTSFS